jgi:hypothetical protein
MCSVSPDALKDAEQWINQRRTLWEARLDRLDAVLAEDEGRTTT